MRLVGVLLLLFGWLISVGGLMITASTGGRIVFCIVGISLSLFAILGLLNKAHQKNAVWKQ